MGVLNTDRDRNNELHQLGLPALALPKTLMAALVREEALRHENDLAALNFTAFTERGSVSLAHENVQ